MAAEESNLMEEREEFMVSPIGTDSNFRKAHFLAPTAISEAPPPPPPKCQTAISAAADYKGFLDLPGWSRPGKKWVRWVHKMHSLHHKIWEKAGILNAIMSSIYCIKPNLDLIYRFSEKWCSETNSFMFRWGEAAITLEDIVVLGGYSVLGDSILCDIPDDIEMNETVEKLRREWFKLSESKSKKVSQNAWMCHFMSSSYSEIEHETFLAYWLSRFVFAINPSNTLDDDDDVISIAVLLARGVRIALAPSVLTFIYRSLSLLSSALLSMREGRSDLKRNVRGITVLAPLALIQVWIFERFPSLRPEPNLVRENEPRMARWHNLKKVGSGDVLLAIDSFAGAESFEWRPYVKSCVDNDDIFTRKIYKDNEYWVVVDDTVLDEEFEVLVRCWRNSELIGLAPPNSICIKQYLPHRVAKQFGLDQDIPCHVARITKDSDIVWSHYNRPISDKQLYVPSRHFEPCVTTRYLKWWKQEVDLLPDSEPFQDGRNVNNPLSSCTSNEPDLVHRPCNNSVETELEKDDLVPISKSPSPLSSASSGDEDGLGGKVKSIVQILDSAPKLKMNLAEYYSGDSVANLSKEAGDGRSRRKGSRLNSSKKTRIKAKPVSPLPGSSPLHSSHEKALDVGSVSSENEVSVSPEECNGNIQEKWSSNIKWSAQCYKCRKWRIIPTQELYEEIRSRLTEDPFVCTKLLANSCDKPSDIEPREVWAFDKPDLPKTPTGFKKRMVLTNDLSKLDCYYDAPNGKKLKSETQVSRFLDKHPEFKKDISPSDFSFIPPTKYHEQ